MKDKIDFRSNPKFTIETIVEPNGLIISDIESPSGDLWRRIANTQEEQIRKGLISLGWTPPSANAQDHDDNPEFNKSRNYLRACLDYYNGSIQIDPASRVTPYKSTQMFDYIPCDFANLGDDIWLYVQPDHENRNSNYLVSEVYCGHIGGYVVIKRKS